VLSSAKGVGFHQRESIFFARGGIVVEEVYSFPPVTILRLYVVLNSPKNEEPWLEVSME
jgi:hypothetical protein